MLINNLKLIAGISAILLLTSCSKVTSWFSSSEKSKPETYVEDVNESEMKDVQDVASDPQRDKMWAHHDETLGMHAKKHAKHHRSHNDVAPKTIVSNQQIPGQSCNCVDVMYNSTSDKEQTLGTLRPGYVMPTQKHAYVHHEEAKKKVVKKKVAKKAPKKKAEPKAEMTTMPTENVQSPVMPLTMHNESPAIATAPVQPQASAPVAPAMPTAPQVPNKAEQPAAQSNAPIAPAQQSAPVQAPALPALAAPSEPVKEELPVMPSVQAPAAPAIPAAPQAQSKVEQPASPSQPNGNVVFGRITDLTFTEAELQLSATHTALLDKVIEDLKQHPAKHIKIQSYAFSSSSNASEARRNSYQRAIAVRKYLIDRDILATRISVNAFEDVNNKSNKIELTLEDTKQ